MINSCTLYHKLETPKNTVSIRARVRCNLSGGVDAGQFDQWSLANGFVSLIETNATSQLKGLHCVDLLGDSSLGS